MPPEALQQRSSAGLRQAQIIVHPLGLVQGVVPHVAADDQHRLAPHPGLHGGGQARRAAAYHCEVIDHNASSSSNRAAITAAARGSASS